MEVAITKISENGQVVIPAEIRRDAGITPTTKFLVINSGNNILLKMIKKEALEKEVSLIEQITRGEKDIREGRMVVADSSLDDDEIDDLLLQ